MCQGVLFRYPSGSLTVHFITRSCGGDWTVLPERQEDAEGPVAAKEGATGDEANEGSRWVLEPPSGTLLLTSLRGTHRWPGNPQGMPLTTPHGSGRLYCG